ncbi:MAG: hypothetical protein ACI9QQ_001798, partial [Myxococcota bacterium]
SGHRAARSHQPPGTHGRRRELRVAFPGAAEAQFSELKDLDAKVQASNEDFAVEITADLEMLPGSANVKFYPYSGITEPYLLGGVGGAHIEGEVNGDSLGDTYMILLAGAGGDVRITESTALVVGDHYTFTSGDFKGSKVNPGIVAVNVGLQHQSCTGPCHGLGADLP